MYSKAGLEFKTAPDRRKFMNTKYAFMRPTEAEMKIMTQ